MFESALFFAALLVRADLLLTSILMVVWYDTAHLATIELIASLHKITAALAVSHCTRADVAKEVLKMEAD